MYFNDEEHEAIAEKLIQEVNSDYEFCTVYEDEELEDLSADEQRLIFDKMHEAVITVTFPKGDNVQPV